MLRLTTVTIDIPCKTEGPFCYYYKLVNSVHKKNILKLLPLRFKYRLIPEAYLKLGISDPEVTEAWKSSEYVTQCTFTSIKGKDTDRYHGNLSAAQKKDLENRIASVLDIAPENVFALGYVFDIDYVIYNEDQLTRHIQAGTDKI